MGALLGLLLGAGLLLIWLATTGDGWRADRPAGEPRLRALLQRAGVEGVTPSGVVSLSLASGVVGGVAMLAVSQTIPVAIVFAVLGGYLPTAVLKGRARRRQREFAELWPEAVDNLASAVRAGLSLLEALTQLGYRGPEPLRGPFVKFGRDYQASGRFGDSLDLLKHRLADPVGDRVCEALRIARDVGTRPRPPTTSTPSRSRCRSIGVVRGPSGAVAVAGSPCRTLDPSRASRSSASRSRSIPLHGSGAA